MLQNQQKVNYLATKINMVWKKRFLSGKFQEQFSNIIALLMRLTKKIPRYKT